MKKTTIIILSGLLSIVLIVISFITFRIILPDNDNIFFEVIAFPASIAGAFAFGSGDIAFWMVVIIETILIWGLLFVLFLILSKITKRNKKI